MPNQPVGIDLLGVWVDSKAPIDLGVGEILRYIFAILEWARHGGFRGAAR